MEMTEMQNKSTFELLNGGYSYFTFGNFSLADYRQIIEEFSTNDKLNKAEEILIIVLFSTVGIFGFISNAAMIYITMKNSNQKVSQRWFVINLAVSDIIICLLCLPFTVTRVLHVNWPYGGILCKLVPSLQAQSVFLSAFSMVAIAVDRYCSIVRWPKRIGKSNLKYMTSMVWMTSISLAVPIFVFHDMEKIEAIPGMLSYEVCVEKWEYKWSLEVYTVVAFLFHFSFPVIAISVLHTSICIHVRNNSNINKITGSFSLRKKYTARQRKNVFLLTVTVVCFAITWLPWTLINLVTDFAGTKMNIKDFNLTFALCHLFALSSVCINPIVNGWCTFRLCGKNQSKNESYNELQKCSVRKLSNSPFSSLDMQTTIFCGTTLSETSGEVSSNSTDRQTKTSKISSFSAPCEECEKTYPILRKTTTYTCVSSFFTEVKKYPKSFQKDRNCSFPTVWSPNNDFRKKSLPTLKRRAASCVLHASSAILGQKKSTNKSMISSSVKYISFEG